jgi:hypothetical protein
MSTSVGFHSEDTIKEAYENAEMILRGFIMRDMILVPDYREPAKSETIRRVARAIADSVIRTNAYQEKEEDITTVPGVKLEIVK